MKKKFFIMKRNSEHGVLPLSKFYSKGGTFTYF